MLKIVLMLKHTELKTLETDKDTITIGRNTNSDIQINNLGVSKKHATITRQNGSYFIEDLNSTNGTLLNLIGKRCHLHRQAHAFCFCP